MCHNQSSSQINSAHGTVLFPQGCEMADLEMAGFWVNKFALISNHIIYIKWFLTLNRAYHNLMFKGHSEQSLCKFLLTPVVSLTNPEIFQKKPLAIWKACSVVWNFNGNMPLLHYPELCMWLLTIISSFNSLCKCWAHRKPDFVLLLQNKDKLHCWMFQTQHIVLWNRLLEFPLSDTL